MFVSSSFYLPVNIQGHPTERFKITECLSNVTGCQNTQLSEYTIFTVLMIQFFHSGAFSLIFITLINSICNLYTKLISCEAHSSVICWCHEKP